MVLISKSRNLCYTNYNQRYRGLSYGFGSHPEQVKTTVTVLKNEMKTDKILVIGGHTVFRKELIAALSQKHGPSQLISLNTTDCFTTDPKLCMASPDCHLLKTMIANEKVTQIYYLPDPCMAPAKENTEATWQLNVVGLRAILATVRQYPVKVFWPSSTAVFGATSIRHNSLQDPTGEPSDIYGISKRSGEYWCRYFHEEYKLDVRSIRLPKLLPYASGTTAPDYVSELYRQASDTRHYACHIAEDNCLPMLYLPEAVRAVLELMDAPAEQITVRTAYNISGVSAAPCDITAAVRKHLPKFSICYQADHRDAIAKTGPASIGDAVARHDWGWKPRFDLYQMTADILQKLRIYHGTVADIDKPSVDDYPDFPTDNYVFTQY